MPRYLCYLCHNHSENHIYWNFIIIQAAVVFDEEEDVDDNFVPRKLFLFSFAHFKVSTEFLNYYNSWLLVMVLLLACFCVLCFISCMFFGGGWGVNLFLQNQNIFSCIIIELFNVRYVIRNLDFFSLKIGWRTKCLRKPKKKDEPYSRYWYWISISNSSV